MKCYHILFKLFTVLFIFFISAGWLYSSNAAPEQDQPQLKAYIKQANELMNTNKNAEALEVLERSGKVQEQIFSVERDSVFKALESEFIKKKQQRLTEISAKEAEIGQLKSGNENIDRENFKMIRNTLFFFGTLVGIAVLLLLNRFRKLSGLKEQLIASEAQLVQMKKIISSNENQELILQNLSEKWVGASKHLSAADPLMLKIINNKQHPLFRTALQLQTSAQACLSMLSVKHSENLGERSLVGLNEIIEEVINQAYFHAQHDYPEFNCTVIKDLEKILPKVDLVPDDIRFVLFNLLDNAFYAVREKRTNAPKGYEPKVTVSTRKLPRFVQIRVRDNGSGIQEKDPSMVFEPFYSGKNSAHNSGLGLSESRRIITGIYKGELIIESDLSTGTDFIIRFPILTLM